MYKNTEYSTDAPICPYCQHDEGWIEDPVVNDEEVFQCSSCDRTYVYKAETYVYKAEPVLEFISVTYEEYYDTRKSSLEKTINNFPERINNAELTDDEIEWAKTYRKIYTIELEKLEK